VLYVVIQSWVGLCSGSGGNVDSSCSDRWSRNCSTPVPAAWGNRVYPNLAAARVFWSYLRATITECHLPAGSKRWYRRVAALSSSWGTLAAPQIIRSCFLAAKKACIHGCCWLGATPSN
jgi:hypothetical protein